MKVLIIEDEQLAIDKLWRHLQQYNPDTELVAQLSSVKTTVEWFATDQSEVDLVFMDIQLEDGLSFDVFNQVELNKPIIFTTAFDQYAIEAFKVNSIDYLLKPIAYTDLERALQKVEQLKFQLTRQVTALQNLPLKKYKDRFLVKMGNYIQSVKSEEIAHFYADGRTVYLLTQAGKKYIVDYKLQELEDLLDEAQFFRVNRSSIINIDAITNVAVFSNSRLRVILAIDKEADTIVSRERVKGFKLWLDR